MKLSALAWLCVALVASMGSAHAGLLVYQGTLKGTKAGAPTPTTWDWTQYQGTLKGTKAGAAGTGKVSQSLTLVLDDAQLDPANFARLLIVETINGTKKLRCENVSDNCTLLSLLGAGSKPFVGVLLLDEAGVPGAVEVRAAGMLGSKASVKLGSSTIQAAKTLKGSQLDNTLLGGSRVVASGAISLKLNTKETLKAAAPGATLDSVADAMQEALASKNKITNPANISCND